MVNGGDLAGGHDAREQRAVLHRAEEGQDFGIGIVLGAVFAQFFFDGVQGEFG